MTCRGKLYDIAIAGAGVVGCAIARELSRYGVRVAVIEKEPDVSMASSCRNSGVAHSGINYAPGTERAKLSVRGNAMMGALCAELKVPIRRLGKLTIALDEHDLPGLRKQHEQGLSNGVPGMEMMNGEAMSRIQPGVEGILGLWTPTSAVISPYGLTIAMADNAYANGVEFFLSRKIESVALTDGLFVITAAGAENGKRETLTARSFVNSAGLHADDVSQMLGVGGGKIYACRGEYFVLDKRLDGSLKTLLYPVPKPKDPGLGIHLTPTVDGNILIGPSADYISGDREDYMTTAAVMESLRREARRLLPSLADGDYIRNFSGNRPKTTPPDTGGNADFIIDEPRPGFIRLQGIESPGFTSAPAIAEKVRDLISSRIPLREKETRVAAREGFAERFAELSMEMKAELARSDPDYGETVCRCEGVTKREVRDAIENPLGVRTLKGIKYRSRAMMGRCQGGFCLSRIARMLREDYGRDIFDYMR